MATDIYISSELGEHSDKYIYKKRNHPAILVQLCFVIFKQLGDLVSYTSFITSQFFLVLILLKSGDLMGSAEQSFF